MSNYVMTEADEAAYLEASARQREIGRRYWQERFTPPEPKMRLGPGALGPTPDGPVTPRPSSKERRFTQPETRRSKLESRLLAERVIALREQGLSLREIAAEVGLAKSYIDKIVARQVKLGRVASKSFRHGGKGQAA